MTKIQNTLNYHPHNRKKQISLVYQGGSSGKEPACQCRRLRDVGSISGSGRTPGGGHGNPLHYSYLENPMDRGAWWAQVHRITKRRTTEATERTHTV